MSRIFIFGAGTAREISLDDFCANHREDGFAWVHLDGTDDVPVVARRIVDIPPSALSALMAAETRPRCAFFGDGALVNMRGLGEQRDGDGDPLVSIRLWAEKGRVVSLSYRKLGVLDRVI